MKIDKEICKKVFIAAMFFLQGCFIIGIMLDYSGNQADIFFAKAGNYLADFINVAAYSAERNPYFNELNGLCEKIYPPLAYVLFYFMSRLSSYTETDAFSAGYMQLSLAYINLIFILVTLIFFIVLRKMVQKKDSFVNDILTLTLFGSSIYLFSYERGNVILLSAICVAIYLNYYDSENTALKHLAFVSLAVAAGLKVYPAIFGILLVYEKRWRDAAWLMIYGMVVALIPFLFLENGFSNIPQMIANATAFNKVYMYLDNPKFGYLTFLNILPEKYFAYRDMANLILQIITCLACGWILVSNLAQRVKWKKVLAVTLALLFIPVISHMYCGLYVFPAIALFFAEEEYKKFDIVYLILFVIFLNPFQVFIKGINITWYMTIVVSIVMFSMLILENSVALFKRVYRNNGELLRMKQYLRLMRVKHYIKNILILLPAVLTQQLFDKEVASQVILGIVIYSLMSSAIYIINDIKDAALDSGHPTKCNRPIASGAVSFQMAKVLAVVLISVAFILGGGYFATCFRAHADTIHLFYP